MTLVGVGVALSGLQLFDDDALWAIGAMSDAIAVSLLLHLLLAFPSGRLEGRAERRVAALGYVSSVAQPLRILFSPCDVSDCPESNPVLIADAPLVAGVLELVQGLTVVAAVVLTLWLLIRRWRRSSPAQRRGLEPVLLFGAVIMLTGLATVRDAGRRRGREGGPDRVHRLLRALPGRVPARPACARTSSARRRWRG